MLKEVMDWVKSLVIAVILAYLIHLFLFAVVVVQGESMEPTLHNGERLIMNKIVYNISEPERGDIIVFHATEENDYIKRVIGLPGETVEISSNQLLINGQIIDEPYLNSLTKNYGPIKVPSDAYFVLGDNRNDSTDSRILGSISKEKIVGRVKVLIWPISKFSIIK